MRGRKPESTELKLVKGTFRQDRYSGDAPVPEKAMPEIPSALTGRAAEWFVVLAEKADKLRMASPAYAEMLALAARRCADVEEHEKHIEEHGSVYFSGKSGLWKKNPSVDLRDKAMQHLQSLLGEFGLSPREIGRVKQIPGAEKQKSLFEGFSA